MEDGLRARAEEALRLVQMDPHEATRAASATLHEATRVHDALAASVASRALGLAATHVGSTDAAVVHLRSAAALAERAGSASLVAEARMTLAFALARQGRTVRALAAISSALSSLDGSTAERGRGGRRHGRGPGPEDGATAGEHQLTRARARAQRAAILQQLGRLDEALADYRAALPVLRRANDLVWVQRVLLNRGVLHAFRHAYAAAERDLLEAGTLCDQLGLKLPAAFVQENLVLVHRRLGDVPTALGHLRQAERLYSQMAAPTGSLLIERSELLLSVRLIAEAREAAAQAVAELERTGRALSTPEARLLLARTAVLDGDVETGLAQAEQAVREFVRQGRHEWVALARFALQMVQAEDPRRTISDSLLAARLARSAAGLESAGWVESALDARLLSGRLRLSSGRQGRPRVRSRQALEAVSSRRRTGPAARRVKAWYATALLRQDAGNVRGADVAAAVGLQVLEDHRATMVATDLRARTASLGVGLATLGLRNAVAGGSAYQVLSWAEQGRAREVLALPARPPEDPELRQRLAELRAVVLEIQERGNGRGTGRGPGRGTGAANDSRSSALLHRQVTLEREVRDALRREPGDGRTAGRLDLDELRASLADAVLLEFVQVDGLLLAVTLSGRRARVTRLGPVAAVGDLVQWLPFGLRRLARRRPDRSSQDAAVSLLRTVSAALDRLLLQPLPDLGDGPLVIAPTGVLQSLPWSLLPSLSQRPLTVVPSARLWQAVSSRAPRHGHVVVAAGPDLPGGEEEAREVASLHATGALSGPAATVDVVLGALEGAAVAHFATHGSVRSDNPLFSALRLVDGPLTVYDLLQLQRAGDTVVLAACDSGRNAVLAGDELLGLSAAFLARDTRHLVASVAPVPDAATAPLMVEFHRLLTAGVAVAHALVRAQGVLTAGDEPAAFAAAAGFVCLGAGFSPIASRLTDPLGTTVRAVAERVWT